MSTVKSNFDPKSGTPQPFEDCRILPQLTLNPKKATERKDTGIEDKLNKIEIAQWKKQREETHKKKKKQSLENRLAKMQKEQLNIAIKIKEINSFCDRHCESVNEFIKNNSKEFKSYQNFDLNIVRKKPTKEKYEAATDIVAMIKLVKNRQIDDKNSV